MVLNQAITLVPSEAIALTMSAPNKTDDPGSPIEPELTVTTQQNDPRPGEALDRAQLALRQWARSEDPSRLRPGVSNAARTLLHRARIRHDLANALNAVQSERAITIEGQPVPALMLTTTTGGWAAATSHNYLAITVIGHELNPDAVSLDLVSNPMTMFGPPFTQA